jgi:hypothetical protein
MAGVTKSLCWACQSEIDGKTRKAVVLGDLAVPVCLRCWESLPNAERIRLAMQILDREPGGAAASIQGMAEAIRERLESPGGFSDSIRPGRN